MTSVPLCLSETCISIHALREEGDAAQRSGLKGLLNISIHALREEGDVQTQTTARLGNTFLSTPSARRATRSNGHNDQADRISIYALREEGDATPAHTSTS